MKNPHRPTGGGGWPGLARLASVSRLLAFAAAILLLVPAHAQTGATGTITGRVFNPNRWNTSATRRSASPAPTWSMRRGQRLLPAVQRARRRGHSHRHLPRLQQRHREGDRGRGATACATRAHRPPRARKRNAAAREDRSACPRARRAAPERFSRSSVRAARAQEQSLCAGAQTMISSAGAIPRAALGRFAERPVRRDAAPAQLESRRPVPRQPQLERSPPLPRQEAERSSQAPLPEIRQVHPIRRGLQPASDQGLRPVPDHSRGLAGSVKQRFAAALVAPDRSVERNQEKSVFTSIPVIV